MTEGHVRRRVESLLRDQLRITVPDPDTDLLDSGLLDSLALIDMIAAMEKTFDIVVNLMDLDLDDVRTVGSITRLVERSLLPAERPSPRP